MRGALCASFMALAGIAIVTSIVLGEYLAGTLVVLMLSGGEALEHYAVRNASSVLRARSVSSMRRRNVPPYFRARSQL